MGMQSHKSIFWKGFWGCGTLSAVTRFCRWQVNALLRLRNMRGSPFYSKYGHSKTYFIKVLTFEKVVENWRHFGRSHKIVSNEIGSNETKNNGWFGSVFGGGGESENYFLTVEGNKILNFWDSQAMTKKIQYIEVKPRNGSKVHIFKQKQIHAGTIYQAVLWIPVT